MKTVIHRTITATAPRLLIGSLLLVILVAATADTSQAMKLIPSVGFTQGMGVDAPAGKFSGGLALRAAVLPLLSVEGGISYRQESASNGDLTVRSWPVTASLWLTPLPVVYAGGGVGWYRTTQDYRSTLPFEDKTTNNLGVHLGGGLAFPIGPSLGLDLNGRYVFMQKDKSFELPTEFNPNFWSASLGLMIHL
jgi:hypothetical protein